MWMYFCSPFNLIEFFDAMISAEFIQWCGIVRGDQIVDLMHIVILNHPTFGVVMSLQPPGLADCVYLLFPRKIKGCSIRFWNAHI